MGGFFDIHSFHAIPSPPALSREQLQLIITLCSRKRELLVQCHLIELIH